MKCCIFVNASNTILKKTHQNVSVCPFEPPSDFCLSMTGFLFLLCMDAACLFGVTFLRQFVCLPPPRAAADTRPHWRQQLHIKQSAICPPFISQNSWLHEVAGTLCERLSASMGHSCAFTAGQWVEDGGERTELVKLFEAKRAVLFQLCGHKAQLNLLR